MVRHAHKNLSFTLKYPTNLGATGFEVDKLLLEMNLNNKQEFKR